MQLVCAKHAQREDYEQAGEQNQYPRLIKRGLQLQPKGRRRDSSARVDNRHSEDIAQCQRESTHRADVVAFASNDPGQYRYHRQYAGRECEPKTREKKQSCRNPDAGLRDYLSEACLFRNRSAGVRQFRQVADRGRFRKTDGQNFGLRQVTNPIHHAALVIQLNLQLHRLGCCSCNSHLAEDFVEIDLLLAEPFVDLFFAFR